MTIDPDLRDDLRADGARRGEPGTTETSTDVDDGPRGPSSVLGGHVVEDAVTISFESVVEGDDAEVLYEVYRRNFEPLGELAVLQHCFPREVLLAELADPTITKIVGWQGVTPVGLGMVTANLDAVPQISAPALRARYPRHAETGSIYFGILVAVSPEHRGMTLFNRIYLELWNIPAKAGGVLVFDICEFNRTAFDTDSLVQRIGSNFPGSDVGVIDTQTFYAAELPNPIPGS